MSKVKKIVLAFFVALVIIQFIQPAKNKTDQFMPNDFAKVYTVPDSIQAILKTACYDCHSNNTVYPWYSHIQPAAWIMRGHINEGKSKLNFSDFGTYSSRRQISKLKGIANEIMDDRMPISSYKLMHPNARLSQTDKLLVTGWMDKKADSLLNN